MQNHSGHLGTHYTACLCGQVCTSLMYSTQNVQLGQFYRNLPTTVVLPLSPLEVIQKQSNMPNLCVALSQETTPFIKSPQKQGSSLRVVESGRAGIITGSIGCSLYTGKCQQSDKTLVSSSHCTSVLASYF